MPSGPSASAIRSTCRLTAASVPRFPWVVRILLSKAAAENEAAKRSAHTRSSWRSLGGMRWFGGGSMNCMPTV